MNDQPFTHRCKHGTEFRSKRCDLRSGVFAHVPKGTCRTHVIEDTAEFAGFHATNIWPNLNGFSGYDTLSITIVETD